MTTALLVLLTAFPLEFDGGRIEAPGTKPQVVNLGPALWVLWVQEGGALEGRGLSTRAVWAAPFDISSSPAGRGRRLCALEVEEKSKLSAAGQPGRAVAVWASGADTIGKLTLFADGGVSCAPDVVGLFESASVKTALQPDAGLAVWAWHDGGLSAAFFPLDGALGAPVLLPGFVRPFDVVGGSRFRLVSGADGGVRFRDLDPSLGGSVGFVGCNGCEPRAFALDPSGAELLGLYGPQVERRFVNNGNVIRVVKPGPAQTFAAVTAGGGRVDVVGEGAQLSVFSGFMEFTLDGAEPSLTLSDGMSMARAALAFEKPNGTVGLGTFIPGQNTFVRTQLTPISSFRGGATVGWDRDKWVVALERWQEDAGIETVVMKVSDGGVVLSVVGEPGIWPVVTTNPMSQAALVTTVVGGRRLTQTPAAGQFYTDTTEVGGALDLGDVMVHYDSERAWFNPPSGSPFFLSATGSFVAATALPDLAIFVDASDAGSAVVTGFTSTGARSLTSLSFPRQQRTTLPRIASISPVLHLVGDGENWWRVNGASNVTAVPPRLTGARHVAVVAVGGRWMRAWSTGNSLLTDVVVPNGNGATVVGGPLLQFGTNTIYGQPELAANPAGEVAIVWPELNGGVPSLRMTVLLLSSGTVDGGTGGGATDAGARIDAGALDASVFFDGGGAIDAGVSPPDDAGLSDDGGADAGASDAGEADGGTLPGDAGALDAGTPDAGTPDAGTPDAGTPDAGTPDAGTPDAGTSGSADAGTVDAGATSEADAGVLRDYFTPTCGCSSVEGAWALMGLLALMRRRGGT